MNIVLQSFNYVINAQYFWPSMAFTVMVGIFLGAVIYDGELTQIKKLFISLFSYVFILLSVNLTRAIPDIPYATNGFKPLAPSATTVLVTVFYAIGMFIGVLIVNRAHKK